MTVHLDSGIRRHFDLAQLGCRGPDDIAVCDHAAQVDHSSVEAVEHIDLVGALRRGHDDSVGKPLGAGNVPLAGFARSGFPYAQTARADCDVSGTQREQLGGSLRHAGIHFEDLPVPRMPRQLVQRRSLKRTNVEVNFQPRHRAQRDRVRVPKHIETGGDFGSDSPADSFERVHKKVGIDHDRHVRSCVARRALLQRAC